MRTLLVTGHSKGIGQAISEALIENGHTVIGVSRTSIPTRNDLVQYQADLSSIADVEQLAKELIKTFSSSTANSHRIDGIVCNAGSGQFGALENFSAEQISQNIQLNLVSPLVLLKALLPGLKQHQRSDIVFVASESALQGGRYGSVYSAAKFGLRGAAQSLRHECASANCHVGIVNPGMVRSEFFKELNFEPGGSAEHALHAKDVANAVLGMLVSADNAVVEEINVTPLQHVVQKKRH